MKPTKHPVLRGIHASLEGETDGQARVEKEIVIYGKIEDLDELKKADRKEDQEQWELRVRVEGNQYAGCIRIRCIDKKKYILTTKTFKPDKGDLMESEVELDAEAGAKMMEEFKKLSTGGMIKTRYIFKIPDSELIWEVDVYYDEKGEPRTWCKIDLEVSDLRIKRPELPIKLKEAREIPAKNRSEDDQKFVERLMDKEFITPSPYQR